ncbi:MAG: hypothetical protein PHQ91_01360 [Thermoanaerobaculaceae bacterium]|nr:hypothetical protein [Thermoanaerobaculaceae bacterium]TAM52726.1 MAG: hypothetical protein EPN53_05685 [Acidobacteriota bacterium]
MTDPDAAEIAYYRAVEDHFASLRGTPFLFSPKDFALLRRWWREGVPLAAVLAGIAEAWERRRGRGEDPVSSLAYCRHAVASHAKRLTAARTGAAAAVPVPDTAAALAALVAAVAQAQARWDADAAVRAVLEDLGRAVASVPPEGEPAAIEKALAELEFGALDALARALPPDAQRALEVEVGESVERLGLEPEVRERTRRALLIKAVRRLVGVPRLELDARAS